MVNLTISPNPPKIKLILAFAAVYLIWGSTYLGVAIVTENLPPLFTSAIRFLIAGGLLYIYARLTGKTAPNSANWKAASLIGLLLLGIGNGTVSIAIQTIPTGVVALLVASLPLWIVIINLVAFNGPRPGGKEILGVVVGLSGMIILIGPDRISSTHNMDWVGVLILLSGTISWAMGTLLAPRVPLPASQLLSTAMQILMAGVVLVPASVLLEDWSRLPQHHWTSREMGSLAYLVLFGSVIGYSAYAWLVRVAPPGLVSTYAYVNPVVALALGALVLHEPITGREIAAAAVIILGVVLITARKPSGTPLPGNQK